MNLLTSLRAIAWLKRIALALERQATAAEEQLMLMRGEAGGTGLRTYYTEKPDESLKDEQLLFASSDADLALQEREEAARRLAGLPAQKGEDEDGEPQLFW